MDARFPRSRVNTSHLSAGFSLVEVSLAIAIIAFAFVSLLGLIPTGLTTFRSAINTANEAWIMQNVNAMVQVTDWDQIDDLDFSKSGDIYYYDEEGRLTDTESDPGSEDAQARRLYGVKLLVEKLEQPSDVGGDEMKHARRIVVVIANITQPPALRVFESISNSDSISKLSMNGAAEARASQVEVSSRAFIATQMTADVDR